MRDNPLKHIRQIHRLTNEIHRITNEIHQITKEIYRITNELYQITKEIHRGSKDRTLQMIIDSINTSERYNECTVSPFGLLLAALRVMPSAPSGTTCPLANARGQTVVVEALWGLGRPSGTACNLPLVSR